MPMPPVTGAVTFPAFQAAGAGRYRKFPAASQKKPLE